MFISVIIPTYNRVEKLEKTLHNIVKQSIDVEQYEIIIVDDCSKDNTQKFCETYILQSKNVKYIRNKTNLGRCVTRNNGIRTAKGDLLVFLDNDLVVEPNFLQSHLEYFSKYPNEKIALVTDITYPPEVLKDSNFGFYIQSRAIGYRSEKDMADIDLKNIPSNYFAGGGSSIRTKDAFSIGLFEEDLVKYGSEDELFGYRFIKNGGRIVFCADTKIIHNDNDVSPKHWKIKYIELGRYGLKTLLDNEPTLVESTLYTYLMAANKKKDNFNTLIKKYVITLGSSSIFRIPIEKFVFKTDHIRTFYFPLLYRYLTVAWMKVGFQSEEEIEEVKY